MSTYHGDYGCVKCDGTGKHPCECCGQNVKCESCSGRGFDPGKIDVQAWENAEWAFVCKHGSSGAWVKDGKWLGVQTKNGATLAYSDYKK